jgi:ABC-type phosphate transport system substrate-binding protein
MMHRSLGLALLCAFLATTKAKSADVHIVVVVNAANPVTTMSRDHLSKIFLREIVTWDNGQEIMPVDQIDKSPARIVFARDVQNQSVGALKRYWQERIFSGNESPPPDRVTDADVLTYVRSNAGAIGYVLEGTDLGPGVKAVVISENARETSAVKTHS